jgi:hypothetical protein
MFGPHDFIFISFFLIFLAPAGRVRREIQQDRAVIRSVPSEMGVFVMREGFYPTFTSQESVKPSSDVLLILLSIIPGINLTFITQILKLAAVYSGPEKG